MFTRADVIPEPFPHVWLDQGLPPDLFAASVTAWPSPPTSLIFKRSAVGDGMLTVKQNFLPEGPVWEAVRAQLAETLVPAALEVFAPEIAAHRLALSAQAPYTPELANQLLVPNVGRLMLRQPGYQLRPHVDVGQFFVTVLHYYPSEVQVRKGADGTRLYRADRPLPVEAIAAPLTQYFDNYGIATTLVKTCPWIPNGCLIFPNRLDAAHGNLVKGPGTRRAYQWHIGLPGADPGRSYVRMLQSPPA